MASSQVPSSDMLTTHRILARHGLNDVYFCRSDTPGLGDCFFHAIVDQLSDKEIGESVGSLARGIPRNANVIRKSVVDFARQNQDNFLADETVLNMLQSDEDNAGGNRDLFTIWADYLRF